MSINFVLIRAYNSQNFIADTIKNALTFLPNSVVLVVNDGSQDNTVPIVQTMQKTYPENLILYNQTNQGVAGALRTGFTELSRLAKDNDNIFVLDSDDRFLPDIAAVPERLEQADVCYLPYQMTSPTPRPQERRLAHNDQASCLSGINQFTDFLPNEQTHFMQTINNGYPLKAIKGNVLKRYTRYITRHFNQHLGSGEDMHTLFYALFQGIKMTALKTEAYNYIRRNDSTTGKANIAEVKASLRNLALISQIYKSIPPTELIPMAEKRCQDFIKSFHRHTHKKLRDISDPAFTPDDFQKRFPLSAFIGTGIAK